MKNPTPATRRALRRDLHQLQKVNERLRQREGTLSFHAEQRGPSARQAETLAAILQCLLSDHLVPAAETLEREIESRELLPDEDDDRDGGPPP